MKKSILWILSTIILCISVTSCHKDCVCKYYKQGKLYDIKTWDDKHVTDEDCEGMNDSYTLSIPLDQISEIPLGDAELVDFEVVCKRD
ncbi:MAG: hypothetical protein MJZ49_07500 [Bacteroidales bacterium]|nr:hypothetical protein [Bacteroidales bacterium]